MQTAQDIVVALKILKPELLARYPVKEIGLFGSFVHAEQDEASDIDSLSISTKRPACLISCGWRSF